MTLGISRYMQYPLNAALAKILPYRVLRGYVRWLGKKYHSYRPEELVDAKALMLNCGHLLGKSWAAEMDDMGNGIYDHYAEKLFMGFSPVRKALQTLNRIQTTGIGNLDIALRRNNGVILVTGHYGGVEFLPGLLASKGYPTAILMVAKTKRLMNSIKKRAEIVGLKVIDANKPKVLLRVFELLRRNYVVIVECDEFKKWRQNCKGSTTFFLGKELELDTLPDLIVKRSGASVVTGFISRGHTNEAIFDRVKSFEIPKDFGISRLCLRRLERLVIKNPTQWYQWKTFATFIHQQEQS
jgi:Kdo2-lipid IVA lauroyltransferase/acyltransferase